MMNAALSRPRRWRIRAAATRGLVSVALGLGLVATIAVTPSGASPAPVTAPGVTASVFASGLNFPTGVTTDASGNLYVANWCPGFDFTSYCPGEILKFAPNGSSSVYATLATSDVESFPTPMALAFGSNGDLYAVDLYTGSLLQITPGGVVTAIVTYFVAPTTGVTFDSSGNLYISNLDGDVFEFPADPLSPTGFDSPFPFASIPDYAGGIRFDTSGNLYVTGLGYDTTARVYEFGPTGGSSPTTFASGAPSYSGVRFDSVGDLFTGSDCFFGGSSPDCGAITEYGPGGGPTTTVLSGVASIFGLAFNTTGNLFATDPEDGVVFELTLSPGTPGSLQVQEKDGSATATWSGVPGAISYTCTLMYGYANPSNFTEIVTVPTCTFSGLDAFESYGVKVVANSGGGSSTPVIGFQQGPIMNTITTITCVKAKHVKHVSGYKPVCPSGWHLRA